MNAIDFADQASEIFVLSDSFLRIKELIDDESSNIDDISEVIMIDPGLSASILKLANSSFFNYPGKIDTISKAVLVLGITEVYNLVIAYFTSKAFQSVTADSDYLDSFWTQSVDCALLIKYLGCRLRFANAERLFILGLLHNLGELVVQQLAPDKISLCQSEDLSQTPWKKQQQVLGFTYAECSAELLKIWQLPYSLVAPIRNQNESDFEHVNFESQLLFLSKRIMTSQFIYNTENYSLLVNEQHLSQLSLNENVLKSAVQYCDLERLGILSILNPSAVTIY